MNQRMTVRQLAIAVDAAEHRIYLQSMFDKNSEALVELTFETRGLPGVMSMEVYSLTYSEKGFIADVGLPTKALKALTE